MTDSIKGRTKRTIIDQVYHQLRIANTELSDNERVELLYIAIHLLSKEGDYPSLLHFLSYYGSKFVIDDVVQLVGISGIKFNRIIELGAGFGWLSKGLGEKFKVEYIQTDSRKWGNIRQVIDIETAQGIQELKNNLLPTDLIVMSDVIHCIKPGKRQSLIDSFPNNDILVLEYLPRNAAQMRSFTKQIRLKGCVPLDRNDMLSLTPRRRFINRSTSSHEMYIYIKEGN